MSDSNINVHVISSISNQYLSVDIIYRSSKSYHTFILPVGPEPLTTNGCMIGEVVLGFSCAVLLSCPPPDVGDTDREEALSTQSA